jgi:hypothetical protein
LPARPPPAEEFIFEEKSDPDWRVDAEGPPLEGRVDAEGPPPEGPPPAGRVDAEGPPPEGRVEPDPGFLRNTIGIIMLYAVRSISIIIIVIYVIISVINDHGITSAIIPP